MYAEISYYSQARFSQVEADIVRRGGGGISGIRGVDSTVLGIGTPY
jgi:hypothetical protein